MFKKFEAKTLLKVFTILAVILLGYYLYHHFEINKLATKENIQQYLKPYGTWIPVVYLGIFIIAMGCYVPASVFLISIGTLLGPLWGSFWGITGCYLASGVLFFVARKIGFKSVQARMGNNWEKFNRKIEEDGFFYVALIRAFQLLPFAVVCYGSAVTSIKPADYIKGTLIGCVPQILLFCYTVPMLISRSLSLENIVILVVTTLLWIAVFGLIYSLHKKQNNLADPEEIILQGTD